jgi:phosphate transport system substrate-binding protein
MRLPFVALGALGLTGCSSHEGRVILQDKGSDTLVNLMARMSEEFIKVRPDIVVAVNGGGTGTGLKALIDNTTDMANASREIKEKEIRSAEEHGVTPHEIVIAHDGLAIYVSVDNPVPSLTFEQLKCIYSDTGACDRWSDLGVVLDCGGGDDQIVKLNRQNNSGTYEYFKKEVLGKEGKFTNTMDQSGTQQVVDVISTSPCAIGYGGMGYGGGGHGVRYACLAKGDELCHQPSVEEVAAGNYRFSRPLYIYTNGAPTGPTGEFIDFILSDVGQKLVLDTGFVPVALEARP